MTENNNKRSSAKKYIILEILDRGVNVDTHTIAVAVGVTDRYVRKLKAVHTHQKKTLTPGTYLTAIRNGSRSVKSLAKYFDVSEKTILRFEKKTDIVTLASIIMLMNGMSIKKIRSYFPGRLSLSSLTEKTKGLSAYLQNLLAVVSNCPVKSSFNQESTKFIHWAIDMLTTVK